MEGVTSLNPEALIPLKAAGEAVDSKNINKHKRDVFRLFTLLAAETRVAVTPKIQEDLRRFLAEMHKTPPELGVFNNHSNPMYAS